MRDHRPLVPPAPTSHALYIWYEQCESVATLPEASRRRGLRDQGALVAANASFLCYSIKSSIRVIHRPTGARALIKLTGTRGKGTPQVRVTGYDCDRLKVLG